MKKSIILFFLFCLSHYVAANWNLTVKNFYKSDCQSGAQNWGIKQQSNNWLYFANSFGLLEFDGVRWTIYPVTNSSNVRAVDISKKGKIYAGAYNEFGIYNQVNTTRLAYQSLSEKLPQQLLSFGNVWQIHTIDEVVYFQVDYGIFKYKEGTPITFIESKQKIDFSTCINGTIYVTTGEGVSILNGQDLFPLPNTQELYGNKVCGIIQDGKSGLIIATASNGLYRYSNRQLTKWVTPVDAFIKSNTLFCMTGNSAHIALGTIQRGIVLMNRSGSDFQYVNNLSGLQNNTVLNMFFDDNGDLWLALDNGLAFISISSPFTHLYGEINSYGSGYVSFVKNSKLYLGTNQGLYTTPWPVLFSESLLKLSPIQNVRGQVWVLNEIDGNLFCGTNSGAYLIKGDQAERISGNPGFWLFQKWKNNPNLILAGNYRGFWALKKVGQSWQAAKIRGFDESARLFEQDSQGNLWMSHGVKGVYKLRFSESLDSVVSVKFYGKAQGFPTNLSISVFKVKNEIVFATLSGIYRYNSARNKMEKYSALNKKLDGDVFYGKLLSQPNNEDELWYITDKNLVVKNLKTLHQERYGLENEMIYGFESVNMLSHNSAIVGDENGFNLFKRNSGNEKRAYFLPAIRRVYITTPKDSLISDISDKSSQSNALKIAYKYHSLRIECNAYPFHSDRKINYFYMLENSDVDWAKFPLSGSKEYTNLHEGKYTFRIKAVDVASGLSKESALKFEVLPPWFRTWGMYFVYFILLIIVFYIILRQLKMKLAQHRIKIEEEKNRQLAEQRAEFKQKSHEKEKEIIQLKADNLQHELKSKTQELANTVMNVVRKNEMLMEISSDLQKVSTAENMEVLTSRLRKLQIRIKNNIEHDDDWKKFEENFDSVHENFMKQLTDRFPTLTKSEKKLCAYLRMDLVSKDIAPLLNITVRGVEISRYRLRQKLELPRDVNLTDFLQRL